MDLLIVNISGSAIIFPQSNSSAREKLSPDAQMCLLTAYLLLINTDIQVLKLLLKINERFLCVHHLYQVSPCFIFRQF